MIVKFSKGYITNETGRQDVVYIALTPFDTKMIAEGHRGIVAQVDTERLVITESLTTIDLAGLDREGVEILVKNILQGGYLSRLDPGQSGEALLFSLVNEAIHVLDETAADSPVSGFSLTE